MALIGVIIGGVLIGFGTHFVPVGGAPAAMGQAPGIATGVAMLAAGAGLAGLFGGAWAADQGMVIAVITGGVGGGLMMAITCMMVNFVYVFGMGIPRHQVKLQKTRSPEIPRQNTNPRELKVTAFRSSHSLAA
jgi:tetrahydromethanopterin S-methyltransferase subunit D